LDLLRASDFWRVRHCPPSVELSRTVKGTPREAPRESAISEQGSEEHEQLASGKSSSWMAYLATKETEAWAGGQAYTLHAEEELFLRYEWLEPFFVGHPDRLLVREDGAVLIQDYKTGPIPSVDYWTDQLHGYQTLADYAFNRVGASGDGIGTKLQVISKFHGVINIHPTFAPEHRKLILEVLQLLNADSQASFFAGPWCRYCPARLVCDQAPKEMIQFAGRLDSSDINAALPVGEPGADLLGRLKLLKGLVEEKIKWYEELVRKDPAILANQWKVGEGAEKGEILDAEVALDKLAAYHLASRKELFKAAGKLSYAKVRDFFAEQRGISAKEARAALQDILGDLLEFKREKGSVKEMIS
jgi:hypothetical protein